MCDERGGQGKVWDRHFELDDSSSFSCGHCVFSSEKERTRVWRPVQREGLIRGEVVVDSHTIAASALATQNEVGLPVLDPGRIVQPSVLVAVWVDQGYDVVVVVAVALRT